MGIARLALLLVLALAPAAHAAGSDPLLSGYGGPGDGEQALLGETLIREDASGATQGATAQSPAPAPTAIYEPDTATPTTVPQETAAPEEETAVAPARKPARKPAATKPSKPSKPTSQVAVGTGGGEPASAPAPVAPRDLALLVALLLGLVALAGWARRLAVAAARLRRDSLPQRP